MWFAGSGSASPELTEKAEATPGCCCRSAMLFPTISPFFKHIIFFCVLVGQPIGLEPLSRPMTPTAPTTTTRYRFDLGQLCVVLAVQGDTIRAYHAVHPGEEHLRVTAAQLDSAIATLQSVRAKI